MAAKKKPVKHVRRSVARTETTALDMHAIALNEYYRALRRAGFSVEIALGLMDNKNSMPEWLIPTTADTDITPFQDDDEDED
jgi:hypothetical protein